MNQAPVIFRNSELAEPRGGPFRLRLCLPLTPLFWLLAPFVVLLAPLLLLAPPMRRINPYVTVLAIGRVLLSLNGTDIDVDTPDACIRLNIL